MTHLAQAAALLLLPVAICAGLWLTERALIGLALILWHLRRR